MIKKTEEIIGRAVQVITKETQDKVAAILLFGSYADGTAIWRSDIDLCLIMKKQLTVLEAGLLRKRLMGKLPEEVDLQIFNVLPLKVKKTIADNHQLLFSSPNFDDEAFFQGTRKIFFEFSRTLATAEAA